MKLWGKVRRSRPIPTIRTKAATPRDPDLSIEISWNTDNPSEIRMDLFIPVITEESPLITPYVDSEGEEWTSRWNWIGMSLN